MVIKYEKLRDNLGAAPSTDLTHHELCKAKANAQAKLKEMIMRKKQAFIAQNPGTTAEQVDKHFDRPLSIQAKLDDYTLRFQEEIIQKKELLVNEFNARKAGVAQAKELTIAHKRLKTKYGGALEVLKIISEICTGIHSFITRAITQARPTLKLYLSPSVEIGILKYRIENPTLAISVDKGAVTEDILLAGLYQNLQNVFQPDKQGNFKTWLFNFLSTLHFQAHCG